MNTFEFAMKMETDGKAFYEKHAALVKSPELKNILLELASDEDKHYRIFKAMSEGKAVKYDESEATSILESVRNIFEQLNAADSEFTFPDDAKDIWVEARDIERKAEAFYLQKAEETDNASEKHILTRIAEEEHKHWVTMENVIGFLNHPTQWLEDGEWSGLNE